MKIRLSEAIAAGEQETETPAMWDEDTMRRVRDRVLERAGLAPRPAGSRRAGRRAAIVLAALLAVMLAFATALATTDLGVMIADMLRGYPGPQSVLDVLGLYGSAVGCETTEDGLTVRVEAAFAQGAESVITLSFEDAQGRLGAGMEFNASLNHGSPSTQFQPRKLPDGRMGALVTFPDDPSLAGQNVELTIDGIIPEVQRFYSQRTALTLGEAAQKPMPFPVPGVPEARFTAIRMTEGGLVISVESPSDGSLRFDGLALRAPGSRLVDKIDSDRIRTVGGELTDQSNYGFAGMDLKRFSDCELVVSYAREAPRLDGAWKLRFQMPRSVEKRIEVPIGERIAVNGVAYSFERAAVYPACVVVSFSRPDDRSSAWTKSDDGSMFQDSPDIPRFTLADDGGQTIADLDTVGHIDQYNGTMRYRFTIYCLTEEHDALTLHIENEDRETLRSYKLK